MSDAPFLPLTRPEIDEQTIRGVADVLRSGWLATGRVAAEFEAALSELFRGRTVRVFNSGAVTIEVALRMIGIDEGHEVITTPLAWAATANAVLKVGARPVFVDIDPTTRHIDPARIEAAITPRTRAIVPVHLGGAPCDLDAIHAIAHVHGLRVVEDASHAIDASWRGKRIGSFGDYASFSFHASQNITSIDFDLEAIRINATGTFGSGNFTGVFRLIPTTSGSYISVGWSRPDTAARPARQSVSYKRDYPPTKPDVPVSPCRNSGRRRRMVSHTSGTSTPK